MIENQPVAFTIILIVVVNTLVAVTSGWAFLAFRSPALKDICGTKHWFTSVGTWVYYKRCVQATVGEEIEQREKKLLSYEMTLRMKNGKALALSGSATDRILEMSQNNKHISGSQGH